MYSNKAVTEMGGKALTPTAIGSTNAGKVTLNDWGDPNFTDGADDVENFGYNASFSVVQQIVDEVGDDKMRDVLAVVADRTIAYRGEVAPEAVNVVTDWRRFLDVVDEIGGAENADELIKRYVVTSTQSKLLDERAQARTAYQQLIDAGGSWAPPYLVRAQMSAWSFKAAQTAIDDSQEVLALRDELDTKTAELASSYPADLEATYEASGKDLDDATHAVQEQIDTADQVLAAVAADAAKDGLLDRVGLIGTHLPELIDEAKTALASGNHDIARAKAQEVISAVDSAPEVGKKRSLLVGGGVLLLLLLVTLLIVLLRRRGHRNRAESVEKNEGIVAGTEDLLGVDAQPVEAAGEQSLGSNGGADNSAGEDGAVALGF